MNIKTCIISGYGINADQELQEAFQMAGAEAERLHIQELIELPETLQEYQILAFPGGFSFGDHLGSGLVFAHLFRKHLQDQLNRFIKDGKLIIGICNGFQVLVKMGVLPNLDNSREPQVSLIHNDSGVFNDSWVRVKPNPQCSCVWTKDLPEMELPIRHGEGRFITKNSRIADELQRRNLLALTYAGTNPNGSELNAAGITDPTGRILGLMPHPEAFLHPENHPRWTREPIKKAAGLLFFHNGVQYVRDNL